MKLFSVYVDISGNQYTKRWL